MATAHAVPAAAIRLSAHLDRADELAWGDVAASRIKPGHLVGRRGAQPIVDALVAGADPQRLCCGSLGSSAVRGNDS